MLLVETKAVEVCVYFLHNLGRAHFFTTNSSLLCETSEATIVAPPFSTQAMRDPLLRYTYYKLNMLNYKVYNKLKYFLCACVCIEKM